MSFGTSSSYHVKKNILRIPRGAEANSMSWRKQGNIFGHNLDHDGTSDRVKVSEVDRYIAGQDMQQTNPLL